ncbi:MAG TPA: hypothetical protein VK506_04390 [Conexibacter sp.]|nr:hypothetical protein [Conexibacter sp.]
MEIDFTDPRCREALERARKQILAGYRVLRDEVGVDKPSDNAFLREAQACAQASIIWVSDRGGADGRTHQGEEVEIKSTRLDTRRSINFPTSRYVSPTVITRFRQAHFWLFAIFDVYEELAGLYRVEGNDMRDIIDHLELRMQQCQANDVALPNNPKIPFTWIRPFATRLFLNPELVEFQQARRGWMLRPR